MQSFDRPFNRLRLAACAGAALVSAGVFSPGVASAQSQSQQGPDLHAILHIRPDQEAAWRAYKASEVPPAGLVSELQSSAQRMVNMNTPQRLDLIMQNEQLELTMRHHRFDAIRRFYAGLSPDQQRIYDQVTVRPNGGQPPQR